MKAATSFGSLLILLALGRIACAHEGHHHGNHMQDAKIADAEDAAKVAFGEIELDYSKNVAPTFENKCAACHSVNSLSPWYSNIPGIHQLVESDRSEAKEHLEISKGFPFGGHGEPVEDLKAIKQVVSDNSMPTKLYALIHPSSKLSEAEKELILSWVETSQKRLSAVAAEGNK